MSTDVLKSPPQRYTYIDYTVVYPATDTEGNKLGKIVGAWIEVRGPGDCDFRRAQFLDYPYEDARIKVAEDGIYTVRHVVVGSCRESIPSPELHQTVNVMPPEKPEPPIVEVPCDPHDGAVANVRIRWCYPKKDIQGDNLLHIEGAVVEISPPGSGDWIAEEVVKFPTDNVLLTLPGDGPFRARVRILGACSKSDPSDPVAVDIDVAAPAEPPVGRISTPCPKEG